MWDDLREFLPWLLIPLAAGVASILFALAERVSAGG